MFKPWMIALWLACASSTGCAMLARETLLSELTNDPRPAKAKAAAAPQATAAAPAAPALAAPPLAPVALAERGPER